MTDRAVSAGCVVAAGLWVLMVVLLGVAWGTGNEDAGRVGLACSAAAATATIRQFFVVQNRLMRNAFELGRDSAEVRPMRHR